MKKLILIFLLTLSIQAMQAQSWGTSSGSLYSPLSSSSYVGIGIIPQYKLDVNGKVCIRPCETVSGLSASYLNWSGHILNIGTPTGTYAYNYLDFKPGGATEGPIYSTFRMYTATGPNNQSEKIHFTSYGNCWMNTDGNFGIGTDAPSAKLDVRGSIRGIDLRLSQPTNANGPSINLSFQGNSWFNITGNLGIGTTTPAYKFDVRGTIRAYEIIVNTNGADFVFEDGYQLMPLGEVKEYIEANHHLPAIQSAAEMQQDGVSISELQTQLLQKVEELTLYILQQQEVIDELKSEINELKK